MPLLPVKLRKFLVRSVPNLFVKGFLVMLPILATIAIGRWMWVNFESFLGGPLETLLGHGEPDAKGLLRYLPHYIHYYPGMGTAALLLVIFFVGLFLNYWMMQGLLNWVGELLARIPLIKSIYGSVRDLTEFFSSRTGQAARQVVLVRLGSEPGGGGGAEVVGLLTREDFADLPANFAGPDMVAVYMPFSYALGGYTILVPRSRVRIIDMSMEDAMRFAITAGMTGREEAGKGGKAGSGGQAGSQK